VHFIGGEGEISWQRHRERGVERDFWEEKRKKISWGKRKIDWWGRIILIKITS